MPPRAGSILFGYCVDILLYGILTVQAYIYYLSFPDNRRMTKATVAFVYAVGTLQTAFALHDFYSLFCLPGNQGDSPLFFETWRTLHRCANISSLLLFVLRVAGGAVAAVSQLFYAHRIYVLSGKKLIPGVVTGLALVQLTIGIFVAFTSYGNWTITSELELALSSYLDVLGWELSGAICDLIITIYMFCFFSRRIQRFKSFKPTRVSLTRIKRLTLESGLLTTGVAVTYVTMSFIGNLNEFIVPGLTLSKIYGNSILALLNSRLRIPGGRDEIDSTWVVDHQLAVTEQQTELQRDESGPSVSA